MPRNQVQLAEVVTTGVEALKGSLYHCAPGIVKTFYPGPPASADVEVAVHDVRFDTDSGERISEPWPILAKVPVLFPKFGGYYVAGPMSAGDHVVLIAFDLDPTVHRLTGDAEDPVDVRRHSGGYWVALPGDITDPGGFPAPTVFTCGKIGGPVIQIDGSKVYLGGTSVTDAVALATKVATELGNIATALTSIVTTCPAGAGTGTATYTPGSVASTLVKSG